MSGWANTSIYLPGGGRIYRSQPKSDEVLRQKQAELAWMEAQAKQRELQHRIEMMERERLRQMRSGFGQDPDGMSIRELLYGRGK